MATLCVDCQNGNHEVGISIFNQCDCPCHLKVPEESTDSMAFQKLIEEETIKQESNAYVFPNVTQEEIGLYLKAIGELTQAKGTPLIDFLSEVGAVSMNTKEYQKVLAQLKMALVMVNRTTGLTNAYILGVAVGYFLAKPEAAPIASEEGGSVS